MPVELVPLLFAAIGTIFVVAGVRGLREARAFAARAESVQGVVLDVRWRHAGRAARRRDRHRTRLAFPLLRFTTLDGREVEAESPIGTSPPRGRPGDEVTVLYDPADPSKPRVGGVGAERAMYGMFVGLGSLFAIGGVAGTAAILAFG